MEVRNALPLLIRCLERWDTPPDAGRFRREFVEPMAEYHPVAIGHEGPPSASSFFSDLHETVSELDWDAYRAVALRLDPEAQERRVRRHLAAIEELFGF